MPDTQTAEADLAADAKEDKDEVFVFPTKETLYDHYEMMVLIPGGVSDEEAETAFTNAKAIITNATGEITTEESLGRRSLGYSVAGSKSGTYFLAEFDVDKSKVAEINNKLRLSKEVARFLIVKKRKKTDEEIAEELKQREQRMLHKQRKVREDMEAEQKQAVEKKTSDKKEAAVKPAEAKPVEVAEVKEATVEKTDASKDVEAKEEVAEEKPAEDKAESKPKKSLGDIDAEIEKLLSDDLDI